MNITVWGINYAPEVTGIAPYNQALCEYLAAKGNSVTMVTGFAYYPTWRKQASDRNKVFSTEILNGVLLRRCWQFVPEKPRASTRILHELSFVIMSFIRQLFLPSPDVFVVVSPPLLLGAAAWMLSRIKRAPFWFHVQDLQPDAAYALGLLKRGWFAKVLYALESFAYRKAAKVSGISAGMLEAFAQKGVPSSNIVYFPNGVNFPDPRVVPVRGAFRNRHGLPDDVFLVTYSGNLGVKQGLDVLVEAAHLMRDRNVRIVISGDGARRASLAQRISQLGLSNITMIPLQPEQEFLELLADTDLAVITQEKGTGQFFFPSKLLRTLAHAKPVLTVADKSSELSRSLVRGGFGMNVEPNYPDRIVEAIETLAKQTDMQQMGEAGKNFVQQFAFEKVLMEFESGLNKLLRFSAEPLVPIITGQRLHVGSED